MMQDTGTTPLQSPGVLGALTTVHFMLIAVLAVLAIAGILYGMKLARSRRQGTRELEEAGHLEQPGTTATPDPDAPGEAVVARPAARLNEAAPGGDSAGVVQERITPPVAPVPDAPSRMVEAPVPVIDTPPPVSVATPVTVSPAPAPAPAPPATDLTRLKGLGPKVAAMLVDLGIPDIATLARLDATQADAVAAQLGMFAPRMARDRWVEQAQLLAAGDVAGFEAKFGKL